MCIITKQGMDGKAKRFVSLKEACFITGIQSKTLRKLGDTNKVKCYRAPSGQRKFDKASLESMCNGGGGQVLDPSQRRNFIYARVSSKKQVDDLSRQIAYIESRNAKYSGYKLVTDVASGINFKRKGLQTILDACIQGIVGEVVVAHRDRLCRFGFEIVDYVVSKAGGRIVTLADKEKDQEHTAKSSGQELAEDLLSIVHVYSCRQMGKRKYRAVKITENEPAKKPCTQIETNSGTEKNI